MTEVAGGGLPTDRDASLVQLVRRVLHSMAVAYEHGIYSIVMMHPPAIVDIDACRLLQSDDSIATVLQQFPSIF